MVSDYASEATERRVLTDPTQFLLLLDVDSPIDSADLVALMPDRRRIRHIIRLSDFGLERPSPRRRDELDWAGIATAIAELLGRLFAMWPGEDAVDVYVAGFAPQSVFFAIGAHLDARTSQVFAFQSDADSPGRWSLLDMADGSAREVLALSGIPDTPSVTTGSVAVLLSTMLAVAPTDLIRLAVREGGGELGAIASLTGPERVVVDQSNVAAMFTQLREFFPRVAAGFPHRNGLSVFLAGPGVLALAAGLASNMNQFLGHGRTVDIYEHAGGPYIRAFQLPLDVPRASEVPSDAEAVLRRTNAFRHFRRGVESLQAQLERDTLHVPIGFSASDAQAGQHR